jgi:hypothetical protein
MAGSLLTPSAPHPANPSSVEAPPGCDVLALHQHLQKPESSLAVQLQTGKNGFNAFLYQARVPIVSSPLCSYGGKPNSQAHPHPLLRVFCSLASAQGQSWVPSRPQTATQYTRWTAEGHQVGNSKGDLGPIQAG